MTLSLSQNIFLSYCCIMRIFACFSFEGLCEREEEGSLSKSQMKEISCNWVTISHPGYKRESQATSKATWKGDQVSTLLDGQVPFLTVRSRLEDVLVSLGLL